MRININNIEKIIFSNLELQKRLLDLSHYFNLWRLSSMGSLEFLRKQTLFNLLNSIQNKHVEVLEDYFKEKIFIEKIEHNLTKNINSNIDEIELILGQQISNWTDLAIFRKNNEINVTLWR